MNKFKRNCPNCKSEISYSTKYTKINADKNKSICKSCASSGENNAMYSMKGDKNPFYGKTHTKEVIDKIKKVDKSFTKTKEFKDKMSKLSSGKNNGMYGKSFYDIWLIKYGKIEADNRLIEYKNKQSLLNSGENNNMYGKPSPIGSGNGWSGWYKGWFFRSLCELTFMIKMIERFNLKWESGETVRWRVAYYDYDDNKKNYFSDFIIENKYMVESKPKKLWNSDSVIRKKIGAIKFCDENGLKYKMIDVGKLTDIEIIKLYNKKLIKFTDRYEIKFKEWKKKIK